MGIEYHVDDNGCDKQQGANVGSENYFGSAQDMGIEEISSITQSRLDRARKDYQTWSDRAMGR